MNIDSLRLLSKEELKELYIKQYNYQLILEHHFLIFKSYINKSLNMINKKELIENYLENTINYFLNTVKENLKVLYLVDSETITINKVFKLIEYNENKYQEIMDFSKLITKSLNENKYDYLNSFIREEKEVYGEKVCSLCGKKFNLFDKQENYYFSTLVGYGSLHDGEKIELRLCCKCFDNLLSIIEPLCSEKIVKSKY